MKRGQGPGQWTKVLRRGAALFLATVTVWVLSLTADMGAAAETFRTLAESPAFVAAALQAELGHVGQGMTYAADRDAGMTNPAEAKEFVEKTKVDLLAIAMGTAHGVYKGTPHLDFDVLAAVRKAIPNTPLVLHGGSGVPDEQIRMAVEAGIRKVNFASDLCYAFLDQVMVTERTTVALDVFMREPIHAIRDYCIGKIRLLGADRIL